MKLIELYRTIDEIAPFALSEEMISRYGAYDNSGILLDLCQEVERVLFSLDLSEASLKQAKETGANCIVTHHPAIYAPLKKIGGATAVGKCAAAGISVISAHLNLDAAPGGIDESLMEALGGKVAERIMQPLTGGGYGRVFRTDCGTMQKLLARVKEKMSAERIVCYMTSPEVKRIASFCGGGFDEEALSFALESGADTCVSSEGRHHLVTQAVEKGLNLLFLTHACSEEYGFRRFYLRIKELIGIPSEYYAERRFL